MKDAQVLEWLRTNPVKASEKLYGYFPVIKKLVLKNSGTRQDAEDIYQEALIILMRKSREENFTLTCGVNTYLYSVCRYLWSNRLKARSKRLEVDLERSEMLAAEEVELHVREEDVRQMAEQAVALLGEKCRQLLNWFYFEKISLKQIALRMKFASEQVAKNQKYRCIEKAKEHLKTLKDLSHE
jgi:RNA polymerase sigma factor (sigma-70 family)